MTSDLLYDEVDEELRATVRGLLAARSPWSAVLARTESPEPYDTKLWATLAGEMGLAGLPVPEDAGGAGATWRQVAVVLEELGSAVAPVPYLGSAVLATAALLVAAGESASPGAAEGAPPGAGAESASPAAAAEVRAAAELLARLASGERSAALVVPFSTTAGTALSPTVSAAGDTLDGTVTSVADAVTVDVLLVPTTDGLYAVDAAAAGVTRTPLSSLDMTRQVCDIGFASASGIALARGETAVRAVTTALTTGAALLASEQVGLAQWCLDSTVDYLKNRYQFGRKVGSFQALKHRLADLWTRVAQARAVARYAAASIGTDDAEVAAALAQSYCSETAVLAAEECVQLHGGIGFTWEHPAHLYLKRAKSAAIGLGTPDRHRAVLANLVNLPPA
ncbi:acyl-CoA dehydrogenase family protein [Virgisporangium aurantiacum]|uniref:Acyl-CoA dehydrogenase n=1 Tax=Virgisporangium aurantiacum TaxID=175570 RepID=A0A8J4DYZ3_9ACTN|nr:acyl-CoA dehydrogenase family protein [Virgisporangium aurantiacum]GIJ55166.1 acyl-CoA dehydrogenase [Virgisporangium aurantiacum]